MYFRFVKQFKITFINVLTKTLNYLNKLKLDNYKLLLFIERYKKHSKSFVYGPGTQSKLLVLESYNTC